MCDASAHMNAEVHIDEHEPAYSTSTLLLSNN